MFPRKRKDLVVFLALSAAGPLLMWVLAARYPPPGPVAGRPWPPVRRA